MLKSILRNSEYPARAAISLLLLTMLMISAAVPAVPVDRLLGPSATPEFISASQLISCPFTLERERPIGEKFLKTTAVDLPQGVLIRPGFLRAPEIVGGRENLRITALLVYTQTTSSRL